MKTEVAVEQKRDDRRKPLSLSSEEDLSDLCIQPSDNMHEEEVRELQEQQDEVNYFSFF